MIRQSCLLSFGLLGVLVTGPVFAQQIITDITLGDNSSQVFSSGRFDFIQGGLESDINLFHSFEEFGVSSGRIATFISQNRAIENIFARVTGGKQSEIFGTLRTRGLFDQTLVPADVNLFLMNPNGIIFGPGSSLSIGSQLRGSFVATTADQIAWPSGNSFNSLGLLNDNSSLLTISGNPTKFSFSQQSIPSLEAYQSRLVVQPGQNLLMIGGDIRLAESQLGIGSSRGGSLSLAGISKQGEILLETNEKIWEVKLNNQKKNRANIVVESSFLTSRANDGGNLSIYGKDVRFFDGTLVTAGIAPNNDNNFAQSGDILIDAGNLVEIAGGSLISNNIAPSGLGESGNVRILADSVNIFNGSQVDTSLHGTGKTGDVIVSAKETISLDASAFISRIESNGSGIGGNIRVSANSVKMDNGAQLTTSNYGIANSSSGSIIVNSANDLLLRGVNTGMRSNLREGAVGRTGGISLQVGSLAIVDGSQIQSTNIKGAGQTGDIIIESQEVSLSGYHPDLFDEPISSSIYTRNEEGNGRAANILIKSNLLSLQDNAQISSSTRGIGDAGRMALV